MDKKEKKKETITSCPLCPSYASINDYTNWIIHLGTTFHQKKSSTLLLNWQKGWMHQSLLITGIPGEDSRETSSNANALLKRLSKIGNVKEFSPNLFRKLAVLRFDSSKPCDEAALNKIIIPEYCQDVVIRRCDKVPADEWLKAIMTRKMRTEEDAAEISCKKFKLTYVESQKNLEDQFKALVQMNMLSEKEVELRMEIVNLIKMNLQNAYPTCMVYPFGSLVTRLANKESFIDILVDIPGRAALGDSFPQVSKWILDVSKTLKSIVDDGPRRKIFSFVHSEPNEHLLATYSKKGRKIVVDMVFNNILSVKRSELINFYLQIDPKVFPLISVIRIWTQFHGFISPNSQSNYSIIFLVLFFLMKKNIIPSVSKLQRLCYFPLMVDGWNVSFNTDIDGLNYTKNKPLDKDSLQVSVLKLARCFFEEIVQFDFETYVLCTLNGNLVPKSIFSVENIDKLPPHFEGYRIWMQNCKDSSPDNVANPFEISKAVVIQDPFDLSTTWSLGGPSSEIFHKFIQASVKTSRCLTAMLKKKKINLMHMFVNLSDVDKKEVIVADPISDPIIAGPIAYPISDSIADPVILVAKKDEYSPFSFSQIDNLIQDPPDCDEHETRVFLPGKKFVEQLETVMGNGLIFQKYPDVVNRLWVCFALEFMSKVWKSFAVDSVEEILSLDKKRSFSISGTSNANSASLDNLFDKTAPAIFSNSVFIYRCSARDRFWINRQDFQNVKFPSEDPLNVEMQITKEMLASYDKSDFGEAKFFALVKINCNDLTGELSTPPLIQLVLKIKKSRVIGHDVFRFVKSKFPDLLYKFAVYRFIQTVNS